MESKSLGREIKLLWSVSLTEAIIGTLAFFAIAGYAGWVFLNTDGFAAMLVAQQSQTVTQNDGFIYTSEFINNSPLVAGATVFVFWASIGLILSNIIYFLYASERSFIDLIKVVKRGGQASHALLEEAAVRAIFRVAAIISFLVASTLFVRLALPYIAVLLNGNPKTDLSTFLLSLAGVWLFLSLFAHFMVVMLRFIALKARLFQKGYSG